MNIQDKDEISYGKDDSFSSWLIIQKVNSYELLVGTQNLLICNAN